MWYCLRCGLCCDVEDCSSFKRVGEYGMGHCMIYDDRPNRCNLESSGFDIFGRPYECSMGKQFWESVGLYDKIRNVLKEVMK